MIMTKDECCPKFDPALWDEKTHNWDNKPFIKGTVPQIFHIPIPWIFGRTIFRMWRSIEAAKAAPEMKDFILMSYDPSPWKSELYMTTTVKVAGEENVRLSGTFISKVFEGAYSDPPRWIKKFDEYLAAKDQKALKYYFYFTYCPKCSKKYGHNYCVVFAQIA